MLNPKAKRKKGKGKFHEMEMGPQKGPLHIEVFEAPIWMVLMEAVKEKLYVYSLKEMGCTQRDRPSQ